MNYRLGWALKIHQNFLVNPIGVETKKIKTYANHWVHGPFMHEFRKRTTKVCTKIVRMKHLSAKSV